MTEAVADGVIETDLIVVGAGIVGLAVAAAHGRRHPGRRVTVLEKEPGPARHQSGRNSGVVHAGLYYRPGSGKALLTADGRVRLERYCTERALPFERRGKVVVATRSEQLGELERLARRATANGVATERIDLRRLHQMEPHVRGLAALHVPSTAVCDFSAVAASLVDDVCSAGGEVLGGHQVHHIEPTSSGSLLVVTSGGRFRTRRLVSCAGLHSDRVARSAGCDPGLEIVPFRGEYHDLSDGAAHLVRNLVYPVPDPRWPFLGVHFTRTVHGTVHVGPNAVLALGREHYSGMPDRQDAAQLARSVALRRLARRYWRTGLAEWLTARSSHLALRRARELFPDLHAQDLRPAPPGIRAQALRPDGGLVEDFAFGSSPGAVHVLNAPSPAATASMAIAEVVLDRLDRL